MTGVVGERCKALLMSTSRRHTPAAPGHAYDRIAWCDVCAADQIFVEPDLAADELAELALAAPGWACSACGAGTWLDTVFVVSTRAA
jgi:hypothetical protein